MKRSSRSRAFTMLEMTVTILLGSLLLVLVTHWVLSMMDIADDTSAHVVLSASVTQLTADLNADLENAVPCGASGSGPDFDFLTAFSASSSTQSFGVFTTNDAAASSSNPALVIWTFQYDPNNSDTLTTVERTDLGPQGGTCPTTAPPTSFNAATNSATEVIFSGATAPAGAPVVSVTGVTGLGGNDPGYVGSCVYPLVNQYNCNFTSLSVNAILRTPGGEPTVLDDAIPLATTTI